MPTMAMKCPKCGHSESVYMSRPHEPPPCPRCEKFVRMELLPPPPPPKEPGGQSSWSSGGGQK